MSPPITSLVHRLWTPWRQRWYPVAFLAALGAAFVLLVATADGPASITGRVGGDFPAFFGAGTIVADGDIDRLYDIERQFEAQHDLFPADDQGALYFAYPPYVAAAYRLLVPVGYTAAYVLQTLLSVAALATAVALAEPLLPVLRRRKALAFAAALAFFPMAEGALLGQNVAVSLLLIVASWRLVAADRQWAAGAVLGLLIYKPQLAIPLAGLYLLSGRWRVTAGAAVVTGVAYLASMLLMGAGWVSQWLDQAQAFNELDVEANGHLAASAVGFFSNAGGDVIGWAVAGAVAAVLAWVWLRSGADLRLPLAAACSGLVLLAPHAQSYEVALMLLTLAVFLDRGSKGVWWLWPAALGKLTANYIGFNFTIFAVATAFAVTVVMSRRRIPVSP